MTTLSGPEFATEREAELIPARMVNEFVYCPRLFYLEWVDGRFEDSDDTALGRHAHRAVDVEAGAAPLPEDGELRAARSVMLSDPELGVVARMDLIEGAGGRVVPVDVKKGGPQPDGTPWPSDEIQTLLQAMVLAGNGYQVDHAEVYYARERRRVRIEPTAERLGWARGVVAEARAVAARVEAPLPLVDSPKCVRCSLAGLCLPDETNALLERAPGPPRRIVPRDPDHRPVYLTEPGTYVGLRGGRLEITRRGGEKLASYRMIDVAQLVVFGRIQVSTAALHALFDAGAPVLWLSYGGWLKGWLSGPPGKYVELRRRQIAAHAAGGLGIARRMIEGKIRNCRTLLRRNARGDLGNTLDQLARLADATRTAEQFGELLGIEGTAARLYFERLPSMLTETARPLATRFALAGRNRRPPPDPVNALLSFCYAMLAKDLVATTLGVGFDPYLGVYHRSRYGRPALALDLAEEFRPLIADSVVLGLLNNNEISESDFISRAGAVTLTADARRTVLAAYERRLATEITHPQFKYKISYRRVLDVQARILAATLVGELPEYAPMVTR
jgi:CRISP-associated protein Cas1